MADRDKHNFVYVIELTGPDDDVRAFCPVLKRKGCDVPLDYSGEYFDTFHEAYDHGLIEFAEYLPPIATFHEPKHIRWVWGE